MLSAEALLHTRDGLCRAGSLEGTLPLWTGSAWQAATLARRELTNLVDVRTTDMGILSVSPETNVLISGVDRYYWKMAAELESGDRLAVGLADGNHHAAEYTSVGPYWFGALVATGVVRTHDSRLRSILAVVRRDGRDEAALDRLVAAAKRAGYRWDYSARSEGYDANWLRLKFEGTHLWAHLEKKGAWIGKQSLENFPPGFLRMTTFLRRAFARGMLSAFRDEDTNWANRFATAETAHGARALLRSIGVVAPSTGDSRMIAIPKWVASLAVGTTTPYPTMEELVARAAPVEALEAMRAVRKPKVRGLALHIDRVLDNRISIHPVALQAAWAQMKLVPTVAPYDYAEVLHIKPRHDALEGATYVSSSDLDQRLSVNSFIVQADTFTGAV